MKYVILSSTDKTKVTRAYWFIFSDRETHSIVAQAMQMYKLRYENVECSVLGAGLCWFEPTGEWGCEHGSTSLNMERDVRLDDRDANILNAPEAMCGILA